MWMRYFAQFLDQQYARFLSEFAWNYKDDLCVVGGHDLALATGDAAWDSYALRYAAHLMDAEGNIQNWRADESNLDKVSFGKSLLILRDLTKDTKYDEAARKVYATLTPYPRTVTGNFWHKSIYPNQVWLDGLYMGMPFYARML